MHSIATFLLGALAAAAPAQQQPPTPRPHPQQAAVQKVVDAMIPLVQQRSGLEFVKPPRVRVATARQWREIVKREFELEKASEVFETSLALQGLYLSTSDEVVLSPVALAPLLAEPDEDAPRAARERTAHHRATVVHELVHALQQQHFGLPAKLHAAEQEDDLLRFKYLMEGHAVLIEELVAEQDLGLEDFMLRGPYTGGGNPSYVVGRRYFVHILRTEGMAGVHARLKQPPTFAEIRDVAARPLPPDPAAPDPAAADENEPAAPEPPSSGGSGGANGREGAGGAGGAAQ